MKRSTFWPRLIVAITSFKVLGSLCLWAASGFHSKTEGALEVTTRHMGVIAFVMAVVGFALILPIVRDPRAVYLGGFFLTAAAAFLDGPLEIAIRTLPPQFVLLVHGLFWLQPVAFLPFLLWSFLREFPRRPRVARTFYLLDRIASLFLAVGTVLLLLNLIVGLLWFGGGNLCDNSTLVRRWGWGLRACDGRVFFFFILAAAVASLALLAARALRARGEDRRRIAFFCLALVVGVGPIAATGLLEGIFQERYRALLEGSESLRRGLLNTGSFCLLAMPFALAYSVVVHRVLDFRTVARRALHYALARGSVYALAALPLAALGWYLHDQRDKVLRDIFSGHRFLLLAAAALLGIWVLRYRVRLLEAVDRHFFREQYDARHVLTTLAERIPRAGSAGELADLVLPGIERALHPESLFLLAEDAGRSALVDTSKKHRKLDLDSALAHLIADHGRPFVLDLDDPRSSAVRLPEEDRRWLRENGLYLAVPIVAIDGSLLAALALAPKKSGAPYSSEDRRLLSTIAGSAAPILELHRIRRTAPLALPAADDTPRDPLDWDNARECPQCGQVFVPQTIFCVACDRRLEVAAVPYSIPGKLRFERRIGAGGMGVVYRAADMALGRAVAVKTLRSVSADQAMKLRREARTAAAVAHQHLASIYGVETWHGMPMLVLELFDSMLAQRIAQAPLSPPEMLELGISLADSLAQLHAADILHRDIKPSNIGFARDGKPKLTDFGIARFVYDLDRDLLQSALPVSMPLTEESAEKLRGTLPYLAPEAIEGQPPDASFDLWSLSIVLYESLIGRKLFVGQSPKQMMTRILLARLPDLRQFQPEAPQSLVDLFRALLHKDRRQRPESATEMRTLLETIRGELYP